MNILSRDHSKLRILTPKVVLGSSGNWADCDTLATIVELQVKKYALDHNEREISLNAAAYFMSSEMYKRRFSPFFVGNVMAGISEGNEPAAFLLQNNNFLSTYVGRGYVYSYDPIGHIERQDYIAAGSAEKLLQPILDNQVGMKNLEGQPRQSQTQLSATKAVNLVRDAFVSAAERDIYTGDNLEILIITQCGIKKMSIALRKD